MDDVHPGVEVELTIEVPDGAGGHRGVDVVVAAAAGSSLQKVGPRALEAVGAPPGSLLVLPGGAPLPRDAEVGSPPLLRGAVLRAVAPPAVEPGPAPRAVALLAVHVVAGPDAGRIVPLAAGPATIGRGPTSSVPLDDPLVSRVHAQVRVDAGGMSVRDLGSVNGTKVGAVGSVGAAWQPWPVGAPLLAGSSWLAARSLGAARASTSPTGDGHLEVNIPPRMLSPGRTPIIIDLPAPPQRPSRRPFPVIALLVPVLLAVPLALWWSPLALLMVAGAPVVAITTVVSDRHAGRHAGAAARAGHARALREALASAREAQAADLSSSFTEHTDPADLLDRAQTIGARLWERRRDDHDVLVLRLGLGPVVSTVSVRRPPGARPGTGDSTTPRARWHRRAPWVVDLAQVGVLGVEGADRRSLARSLVGQAAAQMAPTELGIVVLCPDLAKRTDSTDRGERPEHEAEQQWEWVRWLPHGVAAGTGGAGAGAVLAVTGAEVEAALGLLAAVLAQRRAATEEAGHRRRDPPPWILVVLDGSAGLRRNPALTALLTQGRQLGVVAICLEPRAQALPAQCAAVVSLRRDPSGRTTLHREPGPPADPLAHAVADLVGQRWSEQLGRALAPLRAAHTGTALQLPAAVSLVDLLAGDAPDGFDPTDSRAIAAVWRGSGRSTRAVLGARAGGTWAVDLRRDGPHVLVAGTTGSGKSELLAALVLSLAVVNRPSELAVVLVDYKGGATFGPLARLPHAVGLVTDLDDHLTRRALTSLRAEVHRRERLLGREGCRDIDELLAKHAAGQARHGLERLLIVVDEFRVLAEELPGFVDGLVRLAAVGRSLGIHLVLATQRPAGAVTPEIRANANLRVALRVREEIDSVDVVASPEAARITADLPGRAVARTGGSPLVAVQVARVSGREAPGVAGVVVRAGAPGGAARQRASPTPGAPDAARPDDLTRLVAAVVEAAAGHPRPPVPWTAPLPEAVTRSQVRARARAWTGDGDGLLLGLLDDPSAQRQRVGWWPARAPLAVIGPPRSGRTSALRAIGAAVGDHAPHAVQLAVLAAPGAELHGLSALPHTIAVVVAGDHEHRERVLRHLVDLIDERQLGPGGVGPRTVVLVDGADQLLAPAGAVGDPGHEGAADLLLRILVEGPAVGVVAAIAGGRALLTTRITSVVRGRLLLGLTDPADAVIAGVSAAAVPVRMPPGRALHLDETGVHEVQVALVDEPMTDLGGLVRSTADAPEVIRALPARLSAQDLTTWAGWAGPGGQGGREGDRYGRLEVAIGVGGRQTRVRSLDLAATPVVLVAGRPRSGRTSLLVTIGEGLHARGVPVCVVAGASSALRRWADERTVAAVSTSGDLRGAELPAPVVLVDDVELLDPPDADQRLQEALVRHLHRTRSGAGGGPLGGALVAAGSITDLAGSYRGLVPLLRRAGTGVLLHPLGPGEVDVLGDRVPRAAGGPPGRATLVRAGVVETVQLVAPQP